MKNPPSRIVMLPEQWPAPDRTAWARAIEPFNPFRPEVGRASGLRPSARKNYIDGYGRFLAFLDAIGELDRKAKPFERATDDRLRRFHALLIEDGLAPYTIANYIMGVARVLSFMHPDRDFSHFTRASRRLHREAAPVRDITKQFVPIEQIYGLAWRLIWEAETGPFRSDIERAILFRDGLILALLCDCPIRRTNLAAIELDRHLHRRDDEWWLRFEASEMKADRPLPALGVRSRRPPSTAISASIARFP